MLTYLKFFIATDNWKCSDQFACNIENTVCRKLGHVCDGKKDCHDGYNLDEKNCKYTYIQNLNGLVCNF